MEHINHLRSKDNVERRGFFVSPPPWLLLFKGSYRAKAIDFYHSTLHALVTLDTLPKYQSFNLETGIVSKHLIEYLRSVDDIDKAIDFADMFRSYIRGERKRMPSNVSKDNEQYDFLKNLVRTPYAKELVKNFKDNKDKSSQDYVVLFKMPMYALLETVFGSITDEDVVQAIESYRSGGEVD